MIPVTYPSSVSTSKESQMVVFALSSVAGLQRWTDYIPVKFQSTGSDVPNSFNTNGYIACDFITSLTGKQAWVDYVPVFVDNAATTAWQVSDTGFIPFNTLAGGGTYVSLDLNFLNTTALDSRITFSRGTNATLTDSNGRIAWAPHNLLTNSEDFEAAAWTKTNATITANTIVAPDGTTTAERLTATTNTAYVASDVNHAVTSYQISVYVKAGTGNVVWLYVRNSAANGTAYFDLSDLSTQAVAGTFSTPSNLTITSAGSGWYRLSATFNNGVALVTGSGIGVADAKGSLNATSGKSIFIWGAQLNVGALQSYNPTTPKNLLGFTQEPENAAWTKSNSYVQQNLLTWSQDFDNAAWNKASGATATPNTSVAPDGTTTADTLNISAAGSYVGQTLTVNGSHVFSVYLKRLDNDWVFVGNNNAVDKIVWFNLSTGARGTQLNATGEIQPVGNGWYRCSVIHTATNASPSILNVASVATDNSSVRQGSVYAWGAQLVQGSTAGDYTQTTSAAALTRYTNWDGTLTGRKLVEDTATNIHRVFQQITTPAGGTYTFYAYLKAAERTRAFVLMSDNATGSAGVYVDLAAGTLTADTATVGAWANISSSIQSVGGGWYRVGVTGTKGSSTSILGMVYLSNGASNNSTTTYTGDGTSGIYVSDFQLSNSASVDPYVYNPQAAAASAAYYGPRFDYDPVTLASRGLLIEEQRTNLLTYSEDLTNAAWSTAGGAANVSGNVAVAPDGTTTADKIVSTVATSYGVRTPVFTSTAAEYTQSAFCKADGFNYVKFVWSSTQNATNYAVFNLSNGTVTGGFYTSASITPFGNGWYRCSITSTLAAVSTYSNIWMSDGTVSRSSGVAGDGTSGILVWGAQVELGSFPTSYIPTVVSQVTRNADSASMLGDNFYTWFNVNQGSWNVVSSVNNSGSTQTQIAVSAGSTYGAGNGMLMRYAAGNVQFGGNASTVSVSGNPVGSVNKIAASYQGVNASLAVNGGSVGTLGTLDFTGAGSTTFIIGALTTGNLQQGNVTIRRINYYNTRLDNATLQALTT